MIKVKEKLKVVETGWLLFKYRKPETYKNIMEDLSATFPLFTFKLLTSTEKHAAF